MRGTAFLAEEKAELMSYRSAVRPRLAALRPSSRQTAQPEVDTGRRVPRRERRRRMYARMVE
jgi:hypothetical protein